MSTNIHRMALDLGPLVTFMLLIQTLLCMYINTAWLSHASEPLSLVPGLLLIVATASGTAKTPVWQTLPVSRKDIGRARWWQAIGGPTLLIAASLFLPAFVLAGLGRLRMDWSNIVLVFSGQFAVMTITTFLAVASIMAIKKWGRWGSPFLIPLLLMTYFIFPIGALTPHIRLILAVAGAGAVPVAAALYLLAGLWQPSPTRTPWASSKERTPPKPQTQSSSLRGWSALLWMLAPTFVLVWLLILPVALVVGSLPNRVLAADISYILAAAPIIAIGAQCAQNIRALRGLPFTGHALALRLFLFQFLVQVVSLVILALTFLMLHLPPPRPLLAAVLLAAPSLFFPFALRFETRIVMIGASALIGMFGGIGGFAAAKPLHLQVPTPAILIGTLAVMAAGFAWSQWEITHGHRAYRAHPFVTPRWRGWG